MKAINFDLVIVGVGGQGTLLASKILGRLALNAGLGVKVSEVHGMSQRGGSVITHVRVGDAVHSPLVSAGNADYLLIGRIGSRVGFTTFFKNKDKGITEEELERRRAAKR